MKFNKKSFILILTIAILFNCNSHKEYCIVEIIEGVRHVHNYSPKWADEPKVALEFVRKIGGLEVEDENYQLFYPKDLALDGDGNIYILDFGNHRIQKLDEEGKYLATIGRYGYGPSEFELPYTIQVHSDNHIFVLELLRRQMIELNKNGKEIRRFNAENGRIYNFTVLHSGELLSHGFLKLGPEYKNKPFNEPIIKLFNKDLTILREFCIPTDMGDQLTSMQMNNIIYTIDRDDNVYVAFINQNRIEKYTQEGRLVWKSDRSLDYEMSKPKSSIRPDEQIGGHLTIVGSRGGRTGSSMNTFSLNISVDGKGILWVNTILKQEEINDVLELYNNDGVLLSRLSLPDIENISTYRIFGDRIFFIDQYKEMAVYEYRIVEK